MNQIDLNKPEEVEKYKELHSWILKQSGNSFHTYVIVVRDEKGDLSLHPRVARPCYGELRRYKEKSTNRADDRFPGDLLNNFPEGTPTALAFYFPKGTLTKEQHEKLSLYREMFWSSMNPWIGKINAVTKNIEFVRDNSGFIRGFILNSGDFPPTNLVAALMDHRSRSSYTMDYFLELQKEGLPDEVAFLSTLVSSFYQGSVVTNSSGLVSSKSSVERFWKKETVDLDQGLLWSQKADYNRPDVMHLFAEEGGMGFPYQKMEMPAFKAMVEKVRV